MWLRKNSPSIILVAIIILAGFLRFYKLNWGEGYFSHPDEYHIAAAVNRLSFPSQMNPKLFSYGSFTVYLIYFSIYLSKLTLSAISYPPSGEAGQLSAINPILVGRFYSAFFSTLTIIIIYLISKRLFAKKSHHYLVALLTATMPGLIQQAHFTTPESILTFWLFLTLYLWLKWLEKKRLKFLYFSAICLGLAIGTKIVALTFLPILFFLPLIPISPSEDEKSRGRKAPMEPRPFSGDLVPLREVDCATTSEVARQRPQLLRGEYWRKKLKTPQGWADVLLRGGKKTIKLIILPLVITFLTFFLAFPYSLIDYQSFRSTMNYETGLGQGQPLVFYTRQFINTTPIFFQYQKILPYALGPAVVILGTLGFLLMLAEITQSLFKRKLLIIPISPSTNRDPRPARDKVGTYYLLLNLAFLSYFFPNALLFAKWTRFIAPSFPFFAIFTVYLISKIKSRALLVTSYWLLVINLAWSVMFFSIYLRPDVRITATSWINQNLPSDSFILTEAGNMLEAPLEGKPEKKSFDFYHLEQESQLQLELPSLLAQSDYFIIQSRRIFINHQRFPQEFPKTSRFYDLLFSGQLGFEKIKEFNSYPKLEIARPRQASGEAGGNWKLEIPDEVGEETWSVFDHPVIRIYQKLRPLSQKTYEKLLRI